MFRESVGECVGESMVFDELFVFIHLPKISSQGQQSCVRNINRRLLSERFRLSEPFSPKARLTRFWFERSKGESVEDFAHLRLKR